MKGSLDPSQYGNQKNISIQDYLIRLIHRVVSNVDRNAQGEVNAVLCMFVDWKQAYSRQCHTLGIQSFLKNGVRPSLIPILISYFEDREMRVKWHDQLSQPRKLPGVGLWQHHLATGSFYPRLMIMRTVSQRMTASNLLTTKLPWRSSTC